MAKRYSQPLDIFRDLFDGKHVFVCEYEFVLGDDNHVYIVGYNETRKENAFLHNMFSLDDFIKMCMDECNRDRG